MLLLRHVYVYNSCQRSDGYLVCWEQTFQFDAENLKALAGNDVACICVITSPVVTWPKLGQPSCFQFGVLSRGRPPSRQGFLGATPTTHRADQRHLGTPWTRAGRAPGPPPSWPPPQRSFTPPPSKGLPPHDPLFNRCAAQDVLPQDALHPLGRDAAIDNALRPDQQNWPALAHPQAIGLRAQHGAFRAGGVVQAEGAHELLQPRPGSRPGDWITAKGLGGRSAEQQMVGDRGHGRGQRS